MFARAVVLSDTFLDLPVRARCLYFMLGMTADDDGFINNPKSLMRQCGATAADLKLLTDREFLISFASGVVVIRHWRVHNLLKKDRYRETVHLEEKAQLTQDKGKAYVKLSEPNWNPSGTHLEPQYRKEKEREEKISKEKISEEKEEEEALNCRADSQMLRSKKIADWKAAILSWEEKERTESPEGGTYGQI